MLIEQAMTTGLSLELDQHARQAKLLSDVAVDEHARRTAIDLESRWHQIEQDLKAGDLYQLTERQVARRIIDELAQTRRERHQIAQGSDPDDVKAQILSDYDKHIANLEKHLDARHTRLLSAENQEEED